MSKVDNIKNVSIIGAGSWGTSIAIVIAETNPQAKVNIWAFEKTVVRSINTKRENHLYLPEKILPENIISTNNIMESIANADVILIATPSKFVYDISLKISKHLPDKIPFGFLSKGFCKLNNEILTISQTIEKAIPKFTDKVVAIYGPSHAEEVAKRYHTCLNVAGKKQEPRNIIAELLSSDYIQCRQTDDIRGVEVGGTLKNPAAIAAGMISMLPNCGDNLVGALISEALKEMILVSKLFDGDEKTIIDISGLGDLVTTALSDHSRNRRFGKDIAKQIKKKGTNLGFNDRLFLQFKPQYVIEKMSKKLNYLAEGAYAIEPIIELAYENNISIPVYRSLYEVLLNKKDPSLLIETIKNPSKFKEIYNKTKIQVKTKKSGLEKVKGYIFKDMIFQNIVNKFISEKENGNNKNNIILSNLKNTIKDIKTIKDFKGNKDVYISRKEYKLIDKLNENNFNKIIETLTKIYVNRIIDNFNTVFNWIFLQYIKICNVFNILSNKSFGIKLSGDLRKIQNIKDSINTIYVSTFKDIYDYIFIIYLIHKNNLPFPRFFVSMDAITSKRDKFFIKLAGGFIIDTNKLSNILYRESLSQYIAVMIEHGVPILYFPQNKPSEGISISKIKYDFFSIIIESLFTHTVEIALIPIELSYYKTKKHSNVSRLSVFNILKNKVSINFSNPIYLSDYTKNPHSITGISEIIKAVWKKDSIVLPHQILSKIIVNNDFYLTVNNAKLFVHEFVSNNNIKLNTPADSIFTEGLEFLTQNKIISISSGKINIIEKETVENLAEIVP
ncbi:NAD(P)H-dependent glycerol-3-phosphate dehydrogenase [Spirochaetota bacterium]